MIQQIDKNISTPLYLQMKQLIIQKIQGGVFKPREKILSESQFCEAYNVSRICVRQAIAALVHEGLLHTAPGKGTFARPEKIWIVDKKGKHERLS